MTTAIATIPDLNTPVRAPAEATPETMQALVSVAEHYRQTALDLRQEKVRTLGRGECFVRTSPDGKQLQAISANVPVSLAQGHMYQIPKYDGSPPVFKLTAEGFDAINRVAGIQTLTPPTVDVDGQPRPNPYIERCQEPGKASVIVAVHCRVVAIARSATGNLVAADSRLRWAPQSYLASAVYTAQHKNPADVQSMLASEFEEGRKDGKLRGWMFIPTESVGDDFVGIAAKVTNQDVQKQLKAHTERQKFGERIAVTICRRNAIKKLLGVSTVVPRQVNGDLVAFVPVIAWAEPDSMLLKTENMAKALTSGQQVDGVEHEVLESVSIEEAAEADSDEDPSVQPEEMVAALAEESEEDRRPKPAPKLEVVRDGPKTREPGEDDDAGMFED